MAREHSHRIELELLTRARERAMLRQSEQRYRDFFENAKDVMYVHDLKGQYTLVNRAAERLMGYSKDELLKMRIDEVVPAEYVDKVRGVLKQKLTDRIPTVYEVEVTSKDGKRIPVEVNSRLIYENGAPVGVQGTARDITERWRHQEALRESEERFRNLFENAKDVLFTCDLYGNFTSLNQAGVDLMGYSLAEALESNFARVVAPEYLNVAAQMIAGKSKGDVKTSYELEVLTKFGERILVEISSRSVYREGQPIGVQGSARNITERRQAEEALRASQLQLQQSQKLEAIGQLAGGVAHDFNNLLTAIIGYSDLSLRHTDLNEQIRRNLEEIKRAADRAASLTRQLLAFSRKQILEPKVLSLNHVVKDMHKMLRRMIGEDIELTTNLPQNLGSVKVDPGQIEQIIMNLVLNARDAMPRGGKITIETANITLDEKYASKHVPVQSGDYVMLAVSDTGEGMDRETQSHVFEPFFTTKEAGKGTGLGLSTVYGIVKQSGGYIWVYSEVGNGTSFKVYLPLVAGSQSKLVKVPSVALTARGSETILLVEDEEVVRRMARIILESAGYKVFEAVGASDALRLCYEHGEEFDLMITDVIMPGMSGRVLAERVGQRCPDLPVLYMSGYTDDAIVRHGLLGDLLEFIQKPFTAESLTAKVRKILDARSN
jgi:PAS domain S-box-containing protein